jgi:hypothetical protein
MDNFHAFQLPPSHSSVVGAAGPVRALLDDYLAVHSAMGYRSEVTPAI